MSSAFVQSVFNPTTIVMAYFNNPGMLQRQYDRMMEYPEWTRDALEFIVVDDHSDPGKEAFAPTNNGWDISYQIWRQDIKVRWNQDSCRNCGARAARHPWLLLTDMDHLIPVITIIDVLQSVLDEKTAYRFSRVNDQTFEWYKPHPNSWFMTKLLYDTAGGYDERLAGLYGTDGDFRSRVAKVAKIAQLDRPLIRVGREHTPDASTPREYGRKTPHDGAMISEVVRKRGNQPPRRGVFTQTRVASYIPEY